MTVIDVHAHIVSEEFIADVRAGKFGPSLSVEPHPRSGEVLVTKYYEQQKERVHRNPLPKETYDVDMRLQDMDRMGVDRQILSVVPPCTYYGMDPGLGQEIAASLNDHLASLAQRTPARFSSMATVPLQDPVRAADELGKAVKAGHVGVEIGTNVVGKNLDDPALDVFWDRVVSLDVPVFLHPVSVLGINDRLRDYYLFNFIGNPLDTTIAVACLIFGGVMDRFPTLKVVLSHMGGFTPWIRGRWQRGYHEREEAKIHKVAAPMDYFRRFYYDTIIHDAENFEFGVKVVGVGRVVYATDYPFDMGYLGPAKEIPGLSRLSQADQERILSTNAQELYNL